ncbi:class I SAM-dependent methyltransferase [Glycomyces salinus]|uniref:class I SAM-dependent methyltransferase n=1 Tax=Glycomyces salinus TaxID=980294 RepID=UPI0018ECC247|nr:class I SAM-dependent methyltransferase [Glycomyces salinus]
MPHRSHGHRGGSIEGRHSRVYDRLARWLMKPLYRRFAADIAASAPEGASVLDAGTGPGLLLGAIARARPDLRLSGIDLAEDMIDHARRNLADLEERPDLRAADVADLPFEGDRFDLVVSTFSAHHWDDPEAASSELARVLRAGGRLLVYDFRWAPFGALTRRPGLTGVGRTPFRTGLGPIMKVARFEARAD